MDKKVLLVSGLIVLLGGFFVYEKFAATPQNTTPTPIIASNQNQSSGSTPPPQQTTTGFKDGVYTGSVETSFYGPAQAKITISSGKITDIVFVQYPNDRSATIAKSKMAMPIIKQEVIQNQSANVNTVSGATETSASFIQSIASALSQAA